MSHAPSTFGGSGAPEKVFGLTHYPLSPAAGSFVAGLFERLDQAKVSLTLGMRISLMGPYFNGLHFPDKRGNIVFHFLPVFIKFWCHPHVFLHNLLCD